MSERVLHMAVASFLTVALPHGAFFSTVGHGGFPLHPKTAGQLKAAGLRAGVPDLMFIIDGMACFIELKQRGAYPSKVQRECHDAFEAAGGRVAVCHSVDEVQASLEGWGVTLKAKVA